MCPDCRVQSSLPPVSASTQTSSSITGSPLSDMAPTSGLVRIAGLSGALAIGLYSYSLNMVLSLTKKLDNSRPGCLWGSQPCRSGCGPRQTESLWGGKQVRNSITSALNTKLLLLQVSPDSLCCSAGPATCIKAETFWKSNVGRDGVILWHLLLPCSDRCTATSTHLEPFPKFAQHLTVAMTHNIHSSHFSHNSHCTIFWLPINVTWLEFLVQHTQSHPLHHINTLII